MTKLYLALVLAAEAVGIGLLSSMTGVSVLLLVAILPLTLVTVLLLRHVIGSSAYRARRLSPEAIVRHHQAPETQTEAPEELSRRIVERADEIQRTLLESPSEIQVEMCALGYRACVNDMITLTHLIGEASKTARPIKRLRLRAARRRATDSLSGAREAMPPGALRATRQEQQ